jgi:hypothetical protein
MRVGHIARGLVSASLLAVLILEGGAQDRAARAKELVAKLGGDLESTLGVLDDLVDLGPEALPALETSAKEDKTGHVARAIAEIRREQRFGVKPPARITLKAEKRKALDVFVQIAAEASQPMDLDEFDPEDDPGPELTLDFKNRTFWRALDETCRAANTFVEPYEGLYLSMGAFREAPRYILRHYMIRLDSVRIVKTVDFRKPPCWRTTLSLCAFTDARGGAHVFEATALIDAAEDDAGRSLVLPPEKREPVDEEPNWIRFDDTCYAESVEIDAPGKDVATLKLIRGRLRLGHAGRATSFAFKKLDTGAAVEAAGLKLAVEKASSGHAVMRLTGPEERLKKLSHAFFVARARVNDRELPVSIDVIERREGLRLSLEFRGLPLAGGDPVDVAPDAIDVRVLDEIETCDFPFEFRDVKLP